MHPLTPDLSKLSDMELQAKVTELTKRLMQATRSGPAGAIGQLQMMLEDYQYEYNRRQEKLMEELIKNNRNYKDFIDIS
jgi:hypothetical protein